MASAINATNRMDYLRFCATRKIDPTEQTSKALFLKSLAPAGEKQDLRAGRKPAGDISAFFYDVNGKFVSRETCKDTVNGRMAAVISAVTKTGRNDLLDAEKGGSVVYTKPDVSVVLEDGTIVSGPRVVATFNLATGEQISGVPMGTEESEEEPTEEMEAASAAE